MRGRKPLKRLFAFLATFCVLCGGLILTQSLRTDAADTYFVNITSNNTQGGGFGYGSNCDGDIHESYSEYLEHSYDQFPVGSITACPAEGYVFKYWLLDGVQASTTANINRWSFQGYNANNEMNLQAVFEKITSYTVGSSDYSSGSYAVGHDCNSPETTDRSLSYTSGAFDTPNNVPIMACPLSGGTFLRWELDGQPYSQNTQIPYNASDLPHDGEAHTLQAVFEGYVPPVENTVEIYATNTDAQLYVSGSGVDVAGNYSSHATATTHEDQQVVTVGFNHLPGGFRVNSVNPVTTTGDVVYNDDFNNNQFTITVSGDGTATVNIEEITYTYTATIDAGEGTATVAEGQNYTVQHNGESLVTVVATSNQIDVTVSVDPPRGHELNSITAAGNANYWGNQTDNPFTFRIAGDGGSITIGYKQAGLYTVSIEPNDSSRGRLELESGSNYTAESTSTGGLKIEAAESAGTITTDILVPVPADGYYFNEFTNNSGNTTWRRETEGNEYRYIFTLNGEGSVTANFVAYSEVKYDVGVNIASAGSIDINGGNCSTETKTNQNFEKSLVDIGEDYRSSLDTGDNDIVACVDDENYRFDHWEIDGNNIWQNSTLNRIGTWPKNGTHHTLRAVFVEKPRPTNFEVSASDASLGKIAFGDSCDDASITNQTVVYTDGAFDTNSQPIRACAAEDAIFVRWELDGNSYSTESVIPYDANNVPTDGQNHTLRAVFASTASTPYTVGSADYSLGAFVVGHDCNNPLGEDRALLYSMGSFNTENQWPIMACPLNGNAFLRWELDDQPYSQNTQIQYNASDLPSDGNSHVLRAVFGQHNTVTIRPSNNSYGSIEGIESGSGYTSRKQGDDLIITTDGGTVVTGTVTMKPASSKVFIGFTSSTGNTTWTKGASDNEYTLTITGDDTLVAEFRPQTTYNLDIQNDHGANGGIDITGGSCASEDIQYAFPDDYEVVKTSVGPVLDLGVPHIVACPNEGFHFVHWKLDGREFSTDPVLFMTDKHIVNDYQNHHITALFSLNGSVLQATIRSEDTNKGTLSMEAGDGYNVNVWTGGGAVVVIPHSEESLPLTTGIMTITPKDGYVFDYISSETDKVSWTQVGENQVQFEMEGYDILTVHFRPEDIEVRYIIGPDVAAQGGVNTTQNGCGDETSRVDYLTGLDADGAIDIVAQNIVACPSDGFVFDHWELDEQPISNNASLAKNAQVWPNGGSHTLRAIFTDTPPQPDYSLPYTGSASIWIILGGGIGLVLIPSIVLIRKEYLEEKKGGKT